VAQHFRDRWYYPYDHTFHRHYTPYAADRWRVWLTANWWTCSNTRPEPLTDEERVRRALGDIEQGWEEEDLGYLVRYLNDDTLIRVYRDGDLNFSMTTREFRALTLQAFEDTRTLRFRFTRIRRVANDEVRADAEHSFVGPDGRTREADLTYVLERMGGRWYVRGINMR